MSPIRVTHTRTYALLDPWAQTFPWDCLIRPTNCVSPTHDHSPMVDDPCAVEDCQEPLKDREVCYAVTQLPRGHAKHERWVCWRHVHPDEGPKVVSS
jgi:hypothetical protein